MIKCQDCGSTDNVRRVYDFSNNKEIGLQCFKCRKDRIMERTAQGGVDERPISGPWKESFKNTDQDGKEGDGLSGQTGFGDFL